jgi:hypothetical protein
VALDLLAHHRLRELGSVWRLPHRNDTLQGFGLDSGDFSFVMPQQDVRRPIPCPFRHAR